MPNSYVRLNNTTLTNSTTNVVTFSSITNTYTDLLLRISAKTTRTGSGDNGADFGLQINGLSTNIYSRTTLRGTGSGLGNGRSINASEISAITEGNSVATANNIFAVHDIYITNYNSTSFKSVLYDTVTENNATGSYIELVAGTIQTTNAVSSIRIFDQNGFNFVTGSTFTLYGIRNTF